MKRFQFTIRDLLLLIVIVALAAGWWIDHQRINRLSVQQWEYKRGNFTDRELITNGGQGWEACSVVLNPGGNYIEVLYKRPLR